MTQTFNILQYRDKLDIQSDNGSWLSCLCPVCQQKNFKINTDTGAYKCYTNECTARDIRNKLAMWSPFILQNIYKPITPQRMYLQAEPRYIPHQVLSSMADHFIQCNRVEEIARRHYIYNAYQQTVRFVTKDGKRVVAPQYLKDDNYVSGVGIMPWELFNEQYTYNQYDDPDLQLDVRGKYICMAEGEKCAVAVTQDVDGYECLTPAGFCWTDAFMTASMCRLHVREVRGVLYFQDHDKPGDKKAYTVSNAAWRSGLECTVISPAFAQPDAPEGYDIADCKYEVQDLVEMWVQNDGR